MILDMDKLPQPDVPGNTEAERFSNAVKMVLAVPPETVTKEKKRLKRRAARRKQARDRAQRTASR